MRQRPVKRVVSLFAGGAVACPSTGSNFLTQKSNILVTGQTSGFGGDHRLQQHPRLHDVRRCCTFDE